jgi:hypothetical protein
VEPMVFSEKISIMFTNCPHIQNWRIFWQTRQELSILSLICRSSKGQTFVYSNNLVSLTFIFIQQKNKHFYYLLESLKRIHDIYFNYFTFSHAQFLAHRTAGYHLLHTVLYHLMYECVVCMSTV